MWALVKRKKNILVSRFMGDGECQPQARVFVNGTTAVFAAHPTNWSKTCKTSGSDQSDASAYTVSNSNTQVLLYIWEKKWCFNFANIIRTNWCWSSQMENRKVCRQACIRDIKHTITGLKPVHMFKYKTLWERFYRPLLLPLTLLYSLFLLICFFLY